MATVVLETGILSIHGRLGDAVFYNVKGYQYIRSYTIPRNPETEAQQKTRTSFGGAVKLWQKLSEREKSRYNLMAEGKPFSGYNQFISMTLKGIKHETTFPLQSELTGISLVYDTYTLRNTSVPLRQRSKPADNRAHVSVIMLKKPPEEIGLAA